MSVIIIGMQVMWGAGHESKPVLPIGYRYIENHAEWLLAEWQSPGVFYDRYYVSAEGGGVLYRQGFLYSGVCSECHRSKSSNYIDTDVTIQLPQKQLTYPVKRL